MEAALALHNTFLAAEYLRGATHSIETFRLDHLLPRRDALAVRLAGSY